MRGGDGASTAVPIAPRDASDGRVSGLVVFEMNASISYGFISQWNGPIFYPLFHTLFAHRAERVRFDLETQTTCHSISLAQFIPIISTLTKVFSFA